MLLIAAHTAFVRAFLVAALGPDALVHVELLVLDVVAVVSVLALAALDAVVMAGHVVMFFVRLLAVVVCRFVLGHDYFPLFLGDFLMTYMGSFPLLSK
jgi:hypothetical protein